MISFQVILLAPCPRKVMEVAMFAQAMAGNKSLLRLVPISLAISIRSGIIIAAVAVAFVMQASSAAARQDNKSAYADSLYNELQDSAHDRSALS